MKNIRYIVIMGPILIFSVFAFGLAIGLNNTIFDTDDNNELTENIKIGNPRLRDQVIDQVSRGEMIHNNQIVTSSTGTGASVFDRFYGDNELNSYARQNRLDLFKQSFIPGLYKIPDSYVADIKLDKLGNLYVLGGFDQKNIDINSLNNLITNTGNEISNTSNPTTVTFLGIILKYDSNGSLEYGSAIDSPSQSDAIFNTFEFDANNNLIIMGANGSVVTPSNIENERNADSDVFVMKMSPSFDILNTVRIGGDYLEYVGLKSAPAMNWFDTTRRFIVDDLLEIDSLGNIVIAGSTTSFSDLPINNFPNIIPIEGTNDITWGLIPDPGGENAFVTKLNPDLSIQWSRMFTGTATGASVERVGSLAIDSNDLIYIGGSTTSDSLPHGLIYPLNDTATNGEISVNHQRTKSDYDVPDNNRDAFISVFETNGTLHTTTYLGSSASGIATGDDDFIYSMVFDADNTLYVAGETDGAAGQFPLISPVENSPGFTESIYDTKPRTGFILSFDTNDYNITFSHRFQLGNSSAITDIDLVGDLIYYSGIIRYSYFSNLTIFNQPGFNEMYGPYADDTFSFRNTTLEFDYSAGFVGMLNVTHNIVYQSYTDFDADTVYNLGKDVYYSTSELLATSRAPLAINLNNSKLYVGIDNFKGNHIKELGIKDTDIDGLSDWNEVNIYNTDPLNDDSDGEGLIDGFEIYGFNEFSWPSDPNKADTDDDCINDYIEIQNGLNPAIPDSSVDLDGDGLSSWDEFQLGLNITNPDTDYDGINDFDEVFVTFTNGSNPDSDYDGLNDLEEINMGWDPNDGDMDNDGLTDGEEFILLYPSDDEPSVMVKTDAKDADTDDDGLIDGLEYVLFTQGYSNNKTNPVIFDTDKDGLSDYEEYLIFASAPSLADMDGDGLNDTEELLIYFTNVAEIDSDYDSLNDTAEVLIYFTDPWSFDSDNDTLSDYDEVITYLTDPWNADIDNDKLWDAVEIAYGSDPWNNDTDGDLLPDAWEYNMGLDSSFNETYLDLDSDNMTTLMEYYNNTHPLFSDIDQDNLSDPEELILGTDPWNNDTDGDKITDELELFYGTSPNNNDTDGDFLDDGWEIANNFNATNADMDFDGIFDGVEVNLGTDPRNNDTDNDGLTDGLEYFYNSNPFLTDSDFDTLSDGDEVFIYNTNPANPDTDFDELRDDKEILLDTDPLNSDTDNDSLLDGFEVSIGTNPKLNDTDGDSLLDGVEVIILHTDPTSDDTDSDGMPDGWEVQYMYLDEIQFLDPTKDDATHDPDNDDLINLDEYIAGTDPRSPDTDGDGLSDGMEVEKGDRNPVEPLSGESGHYWDKLLEGLRINPGFGWGSLSLGMLGLGILTNLFINSRKIKGGRP